MKKYVLFKRIMLSAAALLLICFELVKFIFSVQFIVAALCAEIVLAVISFFCLFSKEKSVKIASAVLLAFAVITFVPNVIIGCAETDASAQPQYVIHAGGREKGDKTYLNCEEQFEKYLSEAHNLIEVDFMLTSDKRVVCTHRFEHTPYSKNNRPTFDEFMSYKPNGKYTAMPFERLAGIMRNYPNGRVVFDTKEKRSIEILSVMRSGAGGFFNKKHLPNMPEFYKNRQKYRNFRPWDIVIFLKNHGEKKDDCFRLRERKSSLHKSFGRNGRMFRTVRTRKVR